MSAPEKSERATLLEVRNLSVRFTTKRRSLRARAHTVDAVNDVSFTVDRGETFGLVGESGSGKSTLARALLRLQDIAGGSILLDGTEVGALRGRMLDFRRDLQVIFQDPYASLNPAMAVRDIVGEPLTVHRGLRGAARDEVVVDLLERVGLSRHHLDQYPHEFSGGQRQRIAITRAIALGPKLIVCDEPVSALDVSTQSQVINLLEELQANLSIAYLFIAHDLAVVRHISDRIGVMYLGRLVETGPAERVYTNPRHPYTRALLEAIPVPDPVVQRARKAERRRRQVAGGSVAEPTSVPSGCAYHPRCPQVTDRCRTEAPAPRPVEGGGWAACHLVDSPAPTRPVATSRVEISGSVDA